MKKIVSIIGILVMVLTSCGVKEIVSDDNMGDDSSSSQMVDDAYFLTGELMEVQAPRVLIDTVEAGLVWVTVEDEPMLLVPVHSIVRVQFSGVILESYPGQATGHSLEIVEPFLEEAIIQYDDLNKELKDDAHNEMIVWNTTKDMVAYGTLDGSQENVSYTVTVMNLYDGVPIEIAKVVQGLPDLNWYYDQLEIQTATGSYYFGPEFTNQEEVIIEGTRPVYEEALELDYDLEKIIYEDEDNKVTIEYFQMKGLLGELTQDYINQSLYEIVHVYGVNYNNITIGAKVIKEGTYLTIAYQGDNKELGYEIEHYMTIDVSTSTVLKVPEIIGDQEKFEALFLESSGYVFTEQEGVGVFMEGEKVIFTFVPTDDQAERVFVEFHLLEIAPILNMDFDHPAS